MRAINRREAGCGKVIEVDTRPAPMLLRTLLPLLLLLACDRRIRPSFELSTDAPSRTPLVALGDGVLAANEGGRLLHLGPEGTVRWRLDLQRELLATPVVADGTVVAATAGGEWVGLEPSSGEVRWLQSDGPKQRLPLVARDGRVYAQTQDGGVRALHAQSGGTAWSVPPAKANAQGTLGPVICGEVLVVTRGGGGLEALALEDGASRWNVATAPLVGLTCEVGVLLLSEAGGTLRALSPVDAGPRFARKLGETLLGPPVLADQWLWAQSGPGTLSGLRLEGEGEVRTLEATIAIGAPPAAGRQLLVLVDAERTGWVVGLALPAGTERFRHRVDSALRVPALVKDDAIWVQPRDGRVIGLRMKAD